MYKITSRISMVHKILSQDSLLERAIIYFMTVAAIGGVAALLTIIF